jgi:3'-phosphoadenosine 5'-phosphosulfate sulfotransferase (PAPS reductase)/FAD synthetase
MDFKYAIIIQGIRANESKSRSKMTRECQYFKYYFTPYDKDKHGKDKYMSYRKKKIIELKLLGKCDIERPFFESTANDVMDYIKVNGFKPNPLYYMGFGRVGCFPCIMCTKGEMDLLIKNQPEYLTRIKEAELDLGSTFFPPDYIPTREYMEFKTKKNGIMMLSSIQAVVRYLKRRNKTGEMFIEEEEAKSCMSSYNICE